MKQLCSGRIKIKQMNDRTNKKKKNISRATFNMRIKLHTIIKKRVIDSYVCCHLLETQSTWLVLWSLQSLRSAAVYFVCAIHMGAMLYCCCCSFCFHAMFFNIAFVSINTTSNEQQKRQKNLSILFFC